MRGWGLGTLLEPELGCCHAALEGLQARVVVAELQLLVALNVLAGWWCLGTGDVVRLGMGVLADLVMQEFVQPAGQHFFAIPWGLEGSSGIVEDGRVDAGGTVEVFLVGGRTRWTC
jgi:hypothetical protein